MVFGGIIIEFFWVFSWGVPLQGRVGKLPFQGDLFPVVVPSLVIAGFCCLSVVCYAVLVLISNLTPLARGGVGTVWHFLYPLPKPLLNPWRLFGTLCY